MSEDQDRADPLIRAIGEMRSELLGWIDERLEVLRRPEVKEIAAQIPPLPVEALCEAMPSPREIQEASCRAQERCEPITQPATDDARRRLDNLARMLGERLRQTDTFSGSSDPITQDLTSDEEP